MSKIGIVGLGYVGLPLLVELGKQYEVVGYDISLNRIEELDRKHDRTNEINESQLEELFNIQKGSVFTDEPKWLKDCETIIVTVPTPIDGFNKPDLRPLISATEDIAKHMPKKCLVIYESTVFPGCTEEICVPILELTGLKLNKDFFVGYSPERINPGDKKNTLTTIEKVVSGSNDHATQQADILYKSIGIKTHIAPSIKVAEMSKAIENAQRDLNISFANEVALFCSELNIDTRDVLDAAGTKWNFLPFKPGLVGGHCISVDPYYLIHKAEELNFHLDVIASGRRVNDFMPKHIASTLIKKMIQNKCNLVSARVLIMGITFKENVPDLRNSKVIDVVQELKNDYECCVDIYDPYADDDLLSRAYNISSAKDLNHLPPVKYDAVIYAVDHDEFKEFPYDIFIGKKTVVYDLKGVLPKNISTIRL